MVLFKHVRVGRTAGVWLVLIGMLVSLGAWSIYVSPPRGETPQTPQSPEPPAPLSVASLTADAPGKPPTECFTVDMLQQEAMDVCKQAMEDFPDSIGPMILMGKYYHQFGNRSEAAKWWRKVLKVDPQRTDVSLRLATVAAEKGDYEQVVELCQRARRVGSLSLGLHQRLARAFLELGKPQEAAEVLQDSIQNHPRDAVSHNMSGEAYLQLKQYDKAVGSYERTLALAPNDSRACYGLTLALDRSGQTEKAQQYREKFREIRGAASKAVKACRGAHNDAEWMRQAVSLIYMDAANVAYLKHKQLHQAEVRFKRAAVLDPENQRCRQRLVKLYMQQKRFAEAAEICRQLCQLNPNSATYHLNTGMILAKLRRFDAADEAMRKAARLAPGNASIRRVREQLRRQAGIDLSREIK